VIGERAEGNWGADCLGKFFELLLVMAWSYNPCFYLSVLLPAHRRRSKRLPAKQAGPSGGNCCCFLESRSCVTSPTLRCNEGTLCIDEVMQLAAYVLFSFIHYQYPIIPLKELLLMSASGIVFDF
jgi:hypothetical protein